MPVEAGAEETQRRRSEVPDNSLKGPNAGSAPIKETRNPLGEDIIGRRAFVQTAQ